MNHFDLKSELITPAVALKLVPAFVSAYELAASAANEIEFLGGELRYQILPHLRNWAVEFELDRRARLGLIPFSSSFESNSRNNHRHLELRKGNVLLTISQTHHCIDLPRDCVFRNEHCENGQYCLEGFEEKVDTASKNIYAILTHGQGKSAPGFILCGVPAPDMKKWSQAVNLYDVVRNLELVDDAPVTEEIHLGYRESVKKNITNA
ncbi:MAG: hypothetical protein MSA25_06675 [Clostridiales bacterium]|nr:hypothetical protein [Clostridiales bacterium]